MTAVNIDLDDSCHKNLKILAIKKNMQLGDMLRKILEDYEARNK